MKLATHSRNTVPTAISLIAAGPAVEIGEDYELLDINNLVTRGRDGYVAFQIDGDSMVEHIPHGSLIFVDSWRSPNNGDIVACSVNGKITVKIFQNTNKGLYLVPANPEHHRRQVTRHDNFHVIGVVRGSLTLY